MRRKIGWAVVLLCVLAVAGYGVARWVVTRQVAEQIRKNVAEMEAIEALDYGSLNVALIGQHVSLQDVTVTLAAPRQRLHIERVSVDGFRPGDAIPGRLHLLIEGLALSVDDPLMKPVRRTLTQLGYQRLKVLLECRYRFDESAGRLDVEQLRVDVGRMGTLNVTAELQNLDIGRLKQGLDNPLSMVVLLPSAAISGLRLDYRDASLVRRILKEGARRAGVSEADYTRRLSQDVAASLSGRQDARLAEAARAVARFLQKPGHISVRLSPAKPVPLLQLVFTRNPADLAALLGLEVHS